MKNPKYNNNNHKAPTIYTKKADIEEGPIDLSDTKAVAVVPAPAGKPGKTGCTHTEAKVAFSIGPCKILAGAADDIFKAAMGHADLRLYISMAGDSMMARATETVLDYDPAAITLLPSAAAYYKKPAAAAKLAIDWPDRGAPPTSALWWQALANDLRSINGTVAIFCMGGHGRTGTALALLAHYAGDVVPQGEDVVQWVRDNYCGKTVESHAQLEYLKKAGVTTSCTASDSYPTYHGGGNSYAYVKGFQSAKWPNKGQCGIPGCNKEKALWDDKQGVYLCDPHYSEVRDGNLAVPEATVKQMKAKLEAMESDDDTDWMKWGMM